MTTSRTGNKPAFTLIEVMLAAAVLATAIVIIQSGFLRSATLLTRSARTLEAQQWAEEKLWTVQESLLYSETSSPGPGEGTFQASGRNYSWIAEARGLALPDIYSVKVAVSWPEGESGARVTRETYAVAPKQI